MAPQKARRASSGKKAATKAEAQDADQHGEVVQKGADYAVADKDDDEMELERLVLGDGDGFVAELGREDDSDEGEMSGSEAELEAQLGLRDEEPDLEDVADDAVRLPYLRFQNKH
jgi:U3 small nucleolar RNA-associated protein 18